MLKANQSRRRLAAAIAAGCAGLALAGAAQAVDLRDWGKKYAASQRFVVLSELGNQAVLDKETQLVWQRIPGQSPAADWEAAKFYCAAGNFGGRRGWRLPTVHEMSTLVDPELVAGALALPSGHPFQSFKSVTYWTATRFINFNGSISSPPNGWWINLANRGALSIAPYTTNSHYAWCVRGAGPANRY